MGLGGARLWGSCGEEEEEEEGIKRWKKSEVWVEELYMQGLELLSLVERTSS